MMNWNGKRNYVTRKRSFCWKMRKMSADGIPYGTDGGAGFSPDASAGV
jgi:hypothetical protein